MMKLLCTALLVGSSIAFAPSPVSIHQKTTALSASTVGRFPQKDDGCYSNKPLLEKKSTTPVADRKVSWFERQTLPDVMIEPSYFLSWAVLLLGPLIWWYHPCKSQRYRYFCIFMNDSHAHSCHSLTTLHTTTLSIQHTCRMVLLR